MKLKPKPTKVVTTRSPIPPIPPIPAIPPIPPIPPIPAINPRDQRNVILTIDDAGVRSHFSSVPLWKVKVAFIAGVLIGWLIRGI